MAPRDIGRSRHILEQAVERYGSRHHLAKALGIEDAKLDRWISGLEQVPEEMVLKAIELAASKPPR